MREFILKIKDSAAVRGIKNFLSSDFFPFITAALSLICYYLGLDLLMIAYIGITGALIFLLLDDVTPVFTLLLFLGVLISFKNSPSAIRGHSDYYTRPEIFVPIIIIIVLLVGSMVFRLVTTCVHKKFKLTPVFFGLCALSVAFLLNGANQKDYDIKNLMYAGMYTVFFLGMFAVVKDNLIINKKTYEKISLNFFAFSIVLLIELIVVYAVNDGVITDGHIDREQLIWGWGKYNYYGVLAVMCLPSVIYLAGIKKHGYLYTLYSLLIIIACIFSCSRQNYVCAALIYPVCLVILLWKGKNRKINAIILGVAALAAAIVIGVAFDKISAAIKRLSENLLSNGELDGNGRMSLWRDCIKNFKSSPIFGIGFTTFLPAAPKTGFQFIPSMYHNTFMQMMGACGIIGLLAYLVHRVQTAISYFKNITVERTMVMLTVLVILLTSLVDHHIFSLFPTMVYSCLIAVLVKSEKKESEIPQTEAPTDTAESVG